MRQPSRGKQLRPMFDALDHRIAPSSFSAGTTDQPPADTSDTPPPSDTTQIGVPQPSGPGGSTTNPK